MLCKMVKLSVWHIMGLLQYSQQNHEVNSGCPWLYFTGVIIRLMIVIRLCLDVMKILYHVRKTKHDIGVEAVVIQLREWTATKLLVHCCLPPLEVLPATDKQGHDTICVSWAVTIRFTDISVNITPLIMLLGFFFHHWLSTWQGSLSWLGEK